MPRRLFLEESAWSWGKEAVLKFETFEEALVFFARRIWTSLETQLKAHRVLNCWRDGGRCDCGADDHSAEFESLARLDVEDELDLVRWGSDAG